MLITTPEHLRKARTCYNHLASEIAVKIYQVLCQEEWITKDGTEITEFGDKRFKLMGLKQTQGWIKRHQGHREVTINEKGNKAFAQYFNISI